eukprot:2808255-Rhodomonas_salina.1
MDRGHAKTNPLDNPSLSCRFVFVSYAIHKPARFKTSTSSSTGIPARVGTPGTWVGTTTTTTSTSTSTGTKVDGGTMKNGSPWAFRYAP